MSVLISCNKDKPPTGNYIGNFHGHYYLGDTLVEQNDLDYPISINVSNDTSLILNDNYFYYLEKFDDSIKGYIPISTLTSSYYSPPYIKGKWHKNFRKYYISGSYTAVNTESKPVFGTFEIKSDF